MGDRLATTYIGGKEGAAVPLSGGFGSPSNTTWPGQRHTNWHLHPSSRLATSDIGRKLRAVPLWEKGLGPHLTQWRLHAKFHLDPCNCLATLDVGQNWGVVCSLFLGSGSGVTI